MTSDEQDSAEFKSLLEEVRKHLLEAHTHFDIWMQLQPTKENVDVLEAYRGFFLPSQNAHIDRFYIRLSSVVSSDKREPSLHRLLKMLDRNPALAPGMNARSLRTGIAKQKALLERITDYRRKRAAHWDMDNSESLDPARVGEIQQLLAEMENIFNQIHRAHTGHGVWSFRLMEHDDTTRMLNKLKAGR
jgi:hypothetical protein